MKHLVLAGGGLAHLHVLKMLQKEQLSNCKVTFISPSSYHYYASMFSGYVEEVYTKDDIRVNIKQLANKANVSFVDGLVFSVDPDQRMVLTDKGDVIKYDILSFNIESNINTMLRANQKFEKVIDSLKERECVVIVGGSASSVELALSLQSLRKKRGHLLAPILVSSSSLLSETSKNISTKIEKICKEKGLKVITNERAINVTANEVITNHEQIAYDELLWMEDPKAPDLFQVSKLPVDRNGNLLVEDTLQVKKFPTIFGAGDGVTVRRFEQPFINAEYAKQQAPILWTNIKAIIDGADDGERFISPKNDVSILSTGDSEGLLRYGDWAIHSKWCFTLKTIIDRKFIRQYQ